MEWMDSKSENCASRTFNKAGFTGKISAEAVAAGASSEPVRERILFSNASLNEFCIVARKMGCPKKSFDFLQWTIPFEILLRRWLGGPQQVSSAIYCSRGYCALRSIASRYTSSKRRPAAGQVC